MTRISPIIIGLLAGLVLILMASEAGAWPGTVVAVDDGDTIVVQRQDGKKEKIRLYGIDCPEKAWKGRWTGQPFWKRARDYVAKVFKGGVNVDVTIWEMGESYDRIVGGVVILSSGLTLQEKLVSEGLAWVDPLHCKKSQVRECANWMVLEKEAVRARKGLWRALDWKEKPVAPWKWRGSGSLNKRTGAMRHAMEDL